MSDDKSTAYTPKPRGWFAEDTAQQTPAPEMGREELKRLTKEATSSVGYVAPSEAIRDPQLKVLNLEKPITALKAKDIPVEIVEPRAKGRPKGDRTVQISVRIKEDHDALIKAIAGDDFTVASIVEAALVAFAKTLVQDKKYKRMPLDEKTLTLAKRVYSDLTN